MRTITGLLIVSAVYVLSSCNLINPAEDLPSYIHVDALTLNTESEQGTDNHKITEVWVFADGETIGAFDLPAEIPVLRQGNVNFSFRAGIKNNGISSTRIMYPFYNPYDDNLNLVELEEQTVSPQFTYKESANFALIEDFESQGSQFGETGTSQANLEIVENDDSVFEGNGAGHVIIASDQNIWQSRSITELNLPIGEQVWMELNYKCNNNFAVGVFAVAGSSEEKELALIINPTTDSNGIDKWNKIYIEFSQVVAQYPNAQHFDVYFESVRSEEVTEADLWLDNIKIVHF